MSEIWKSLDVRGIITSKRELDYGSMAIRFWPHYYNNVNEIEKIFETIGSFVSSNGS